MLTHTPVVLTPTLAECNEPAPLPSECYHSVRKFKDRFRINMNTQTAVTFPSRVVYNTRCISYIVPGTLYIYFEVSGTGMPYLVCHLSRYLIYHAAQIMDLPLRTGCCCCCCFCITIFVRMTVGSCCAVLGCGQRNSQRTKAAAAASFDIFLN